MASVLSLVIPTYNAASTVEKTVADIPSDYVNEITLVDDFSCAHRLEIAKKMGQHATGHPQNCGYGGNQRTSYQEALTLGADVAAMLHPNCQYTPKLVVAMASMIPTGNTTSRILRGSAILGGMPVYKYVSNRLLTWTSVAIPSSGTS